MEVQCNLFEKIVELEQELATLKALVEEYKLKNQQLEEELVAHKNMVSRLSSNPNYGLEVTNNQNDISFFHGYYNCSKPFWVLLQHVFPMSMFLEHLLLYILDNICLNWNN